MQANNLTNLARWVQHDTVVTMQNAQKLYYTEAAIGDYKYSARQSDFKGWMLCDGRSLDKSTFNYLYEILGNAFGATSTTFNLPDFRGRVPGAIGQGPNLSDRTMGTSVGTETHVLTSTEMPAHTHTGTTDAGNVTLNNATGSVRAVGGGDNIDVAGAGGISGGNTVSDINANAHTHTFTTDSVGGGMAHNNMQPTIFAGNVFIFTGMLVAEEILG
jgi:microcystin-dependent protein